MPCCPEPWTTADTASDEAGLCGLNRKQRSAGPTERLELVSQSSQLATASAAFEPRMSRGGAAAEKLTELDFD